MWIKSLGRSQAMVWSERISFASSLPISVMSAMISPSVTRDSFPKKNRGGKLDREALVDLQSCFVCLFLVLVEFPRIQLLQGTHTRRQLWYNGMPCLQGNRFGVGEFGVRQRYSCFKS